MIVSICIPTINRSKLLSEALLSLRNPNLYRNFEVCISNNASEQSYELETQLIAHLQAEGMQITYIEQPGRISLDHNMLECVRMARGEYVYYLGDDDSFRPGGLVKLLDYLELERPDLVVITDSCENTPTKYPNLEAAYRDLHDKSTFGAIAVKRALINQSSFRALIGTSHAYACFWATLFNDGSVARRKVIRYNAPIIRLGEAQKTYHDRFAEVIYKEIPEWYEKMDGLTQFKHSVFRELRKRHFDKQLRLRTLMRFKADGVDVRLIASLAKEANICLPKWKSAITQLIPNIVIRMILSLRSALRMAANNCE